MAGFREIASPEDLRNAVRGKSNAQITREVIEAGVDQVLMLVFMGFMVSFKPERAQGVRAVIEYQVTALDKKFRYQIKIADGQCAVQENGTDRPDLTFRLNVAEFLKLVSKQFNLAWAAYMLLTKTKGDRKIAQQMVRWF